MLLIKEGTTLVPVSGQHHCTAGRRLANEGEGCTLELASLLHLMYLGLGWLSARLWHMGIV